MKSRFGSHFRQLCRQFHFVSNAIYPNDVSSKVREESNNNFLFGVVTFHFCNFSVEAPEKYGYFLIQKTGFQS